jgi:ankyrin repeat protein
VKFAVLIEPRLLQLVDENGMTPLHWSAYRDYNSLSKLV